jgi:phage tail-like protein
VTFFSSTPAISVFFSVTVDTLSLGNWSKLSGIGMSMNSVDRPDTAMSFFHNHLPGALTYSPVTLERQVGPETAQTMNWFSTYHMFPVPVTAQIMCLTQEGEPVMGWELIGVSPDSWKGPNLDAATPSVGVETLVIKYTGFV